MPKLMISDNGKSFKATHLKSFITRNELTLRRLHGGVDYLRGYCNQQNDSFGSL